MIEIGRICIKLAGRDAGKECVVVDILEKKHVLIDGGVRRRKCNIAHLEPTTKKIKIDKNASHDVVKKEFEKLNFGVWETKPKDKKEKPKKQHKVKETAKGKEDKKAKETKPKAEKKQKPAAKKKAVKK